MRILFVTGGGAATVFAVAPLAAALRCAGHEVLVAVPRENAADAAGVGLPAVAVTDTTVVAAMFHDRDGRPLPHPSGPAEEVAFAARAFARLAAAGLDTLTELADHWRPHLVVGGAQSHAGAIVAHGLKVPYVRMAWDVHEQTDSDLPAATDELAPELARRDLEAIPAADVFLTTTPASLRPADAEAATIMRWQAGTRQVPLEPWVFARSGRPRVLVTSGSRAHLVPAILGVPFLRRLVGSPALADAEVVVATDDSVAAELRAEHPEVRAGWIPLEAVAPTCDLVVHHGGGVTAMHALAAGVPQLTTTVLSLSSGPMRRIAATGASLDLDAARTDDDGIATAVGALLGDPRHRDAASALRAEIEAAPSPATVAADLLELA